MRRVNVAGITHNMMKLLGLDSYMRGHFYGIGKGNPRSNSIPRKACMATNVAKIHKEVSAICIASDYIKFTSSRDCSSVQNDYKLTMSLQTRCKQMWH